jgi:hypothetical protein
MTLREVLVVNKVLQANCISKHKITFTDEHNQTVINLVFNINSPFFSVIWNSSADGSAGKRIGKKKRQIPVSGFSNVTYAYSITGNYKD